MTLITLYIILIRGGGGGNGVRLERFALPEDYLGFKKRKKNGEDIR